MAQTMTSRAVIFNEDGKLLMTERKRDGKHYFSLPGGHVDDGETAEDTVIREVKEELGLAVTIARLLYLGTDGLGQVQHIFLCNYHGGDPELQPDSDEAKRMADKKGDVWKPGWFAADQLRDATVYPYGLLELLDEDVAQDFANNPRQITEPLETEK